MCGTILEKLVYRDFSGSSYFSLNGKRERKKIIHFEKKTQKVCCTAIFKKEPKSMANRFKSKTEKMRKKRSIDTNNSMYSNFSLNYYPTKLKSNEFVFVNIPRIFVVREGCVSHYVTIPHSSTVIKNTIRTEGEREKYRSGAHGYSKHK